MHKSVVAAAVCLALGGAVREARAHSGREAVQPMSLSATSTLKGKGERYAAWRAVDMDMASSDDMSTQYFTTAWCEGKKNEGVGEALTISGEPLTVTSLMIAAGFWKSEKLFAKNNRPTRLTVTVTSLEGSAQTYDVEVPADMTMTTVDLGATVEVASVTIQFAAVKKGKINDTCISQVQLFRDGTPLVPFLDSAGAIDELGAAIGMLDAGLTACDGSGPIKFPLSYKQLPAPTFEKEAVKKKFKKAKDLAKACKKGQAPMPIGEYDLSMMAPEGPGKVVLMAPGGNEYGAQRYHFKRVVGDAASWWDLTAVDY